MSRCLSGGAQLLVRNAPERPSCLRASGSSLLFFWRPDLYLRAYVHSKSTHPATQPSDTGRWSSSQPFELSLEYPPLTLALRDCVLLRLELQRPTVRVYLSSILGRRNSRSLSLPARRGAVIVVNRYAAHPSLGLSTSARSKAALRSPRTQVKISTRVESRGPTCAISPNSR